MDLLSLVFPKRCLSCKRGNRYICSSCLEKVPKYSPVCFSCHRFSPRGLTHPSCKHKTNIEGFLSGYKYSGVIRFALIRFKYNFAYDIARELSEAFCGEINPNLIPRNSVIMPIPLHNKRQLWRGFNQAEILGKLVAKTLNLDFADNILIRVQNNLQQARLDKDSRLRNTCGIFAVNKAELNKLKGKTIIVFDDVCTTGATIEEAAKVLKGEGVEKIWAMSLAK